MIGSFSRRLFLSLCLIMMAAMPAFAASEDEGLYDALPPEGSAFVRFVHAQPDIGGDLPPIVNGKKRDGLRFSKAKPYGVVPPGKVTAELGPVKKEFEAEKNTYYTLILQNNDFKIVKDPEAKDPLKAQIIVYNTTGRDDISIRTADGKVTVVGPVKAGEVLDRAVNPIKVSFAVYAGEEKYADLPDWPLERKERFIIAVMTDDKGQGVAFYDRARVSEE